MCLTNSPGTVTSLAKVSTTRRKKKIVYLLLWLKYKINSASLSLFWFKNAVWSDHLPNSSWRAEDNCEISVLRIMFKMGLITLKVVIRITSSSKPIVRSYLSFPSREITGKVTLSFSRVSFLKNFKFSANVFKISEVFKYHLFKNIWKIQANSTLFLYQISWIF